MVVPENDKLVVDAQVEPQDIENVTVGQKANVHFSAFADRNLRETTGEVLTVTPDLVEDAATPAEILPHQAAVARPVTRTAAR